MWQKQEESASAGAWTRQLITGVKLKPWVVRIGSTNQLK